MPNRKEPQLNLEPQLDLSQPAPTRQNKPAAPAFAHTSDKASKDRTQDSPTHSTIPLLTERPTSTPPPASQTSTLQSGAAAHPEAVLHRAKEIQSARRAQQAASPTTQEASSDLVRGTHAVESARQKASQQDGIQQKSDASGASGGPVDHQPPASPPHSSFCGWSAIGLLALILMLSGLGAWQVLELNQQLQNQISDNQQLQAQIGDLEAALSDRLEELEVRLLETDEGLSQTGQTFRGRLDWADEEIHKLWRLANNRMRPAISELQEQVSPLPEQITRLESAIQPLPNRVSQLQREQQALGERLSAQQSEAQEVQRRLQQQVQQVEQQMMEASLMLTALNEQVRNRAAQEQINALQAQVQGLVDQWRTELQPQLASQTEQLNSLDLSRQQLVSRVTQLMDEMGELYQRLGQSAP